MNAQMCCVRSSSAAETQVITQTETVESDKKDMETILSLLPQEKEVTTEEDFSGTLHLDLDSIKLSQPAMEVLPSR